MTVVAMVPSFAELVRAHQKGVWRYLRFLGADEALADDLTQEVFVAVFSRPFEYQGEGQTRVYLRASARHKFIAAQRLARRQFSLEELDIRDRVFAARAGEDDADGYHDALAQCMQTLPGRGRELLQRYYGAEGSRAGTAAALGMKEEALKKTLYRLREALRECIQRRLSHAS